MQFFQLSLNLTTVFDTSLLFSSRLTANLFSSLDAIALFCVYWIVYIAIKTDVLFHARCLFRMDEKNLPKKKLHNNRSKMYTESQIR